MFLVVKTNKSVFLVLIQLKDWSEHLILMILILISPYQFLSYFSSTALYNLNRFRDTNIKLRYHINVVEPFVLISELFRSFVVKENLTICVLLL